MNNKYLYITFLLLATSFNLKAQDIHFSQYFNSPGNLNPALAGFSDTKMRFSLNNKTQWASVTVPYRTYSAYVDYQFFKRKYKADLLGVSLTAYKDEAGDSKFGTTQLNLSVSYVKSLNKKNSSIISVGAMAGYAQRTIDYSELYFDIQYNGSHYDPNITSGEFFAVDGYNFMDFAAGVNWFYLKKYELRFNSGLSIWHINTPLQSLTNDETVKLNAKIIAYHETELHLNRTYHLMPSAFVAFQGKYKEILLGTRLRYITHQQREKYTAMVFGLFYRNMDAMIGYAGLEYLNLTFGVTYDFNVSSLMKASYALGGLELGLIYKININRVKPPKPMFCPIF